MAAHGRHHAVYLAVIAVLIIVVVAVAGYGYRARQIEKAVLRRYGLDQELRASSPRKGLLRGLSGPALLRPRSFAQYRAEVDALVEAAGRLEDFGPPTRLAAACRRAVAGGKRLRPIILLEVARAATLGRRRAGGADPDELAVPVDAADLALAVEYLHAASLVIDDLPEFDDDSVRRGQPSLHAEVGPALAQLAALSLVSAAFQNVARQLDWVRDFCPGAKNVDRVGTRLCNEISRAIGSLGAAGGQYMDISTPEQLRDEFGAEAVQEMLCRKTASLFEIATVSGWLIAGGGAEGIDDLRAIGRHVGLAFQIADDIGDMAKDAARVAASKPGSNYANTYGREAAEREMHRNLRAAHSLLKTRGLWTPLWAEGIWPQVLAMVAEQQPQQPPQQPPPPPQQQPPQGAPMPLKTASAKEKAGAAEPPPETAPPPEAALDSPPRPGHQLQEAVASQ